MTMASWWLVRPIRWSVRRFLGGVLVGVFFLRAPGPSCCLLALAGGCWGGLGGFWGGGSRPGGVGGGLGGCAVAGGGEWVVGREAAGGGGGRGVPSGGAWCLMFVFSSWGGGGRVGGRGFWGGGPL